MDEIFQINPIAVEDGIPIFSSCDDYVMNYDEICNDHLSSISEQSENPWIDDVSWKMYENSTVEYAKKYITNDSKILDVGVGLGRVLKQLPLGTLYGNDVAIDYLKKARREDINVALAKVEELPYKDSLFDVVVCTDVLEHVFDLYGATKQIERVLKAGGYLIVRVPYREILDGYLDDTLKYNFVHVRSFCLNELRLHFEKIFSFNYIEHELLNFEYFGIPNFELKLPRLGSPLFDIINSVDDHPELSYLSGLKGISEEGLAELVINLKNNYPDTYKTMSKMINVPLEISIVFQKKG